MARTLRSAALVGLAAISLASTEVVREGAEFRVNTHTDDSQARAAVAVGGTGEFVVVWDSFLQDGSSWGVFGQRLDSSAAPMAAEFPANTYTTSGQRAARVARDAAGNFVVVWLSPAGLSTDIFARLYDSGGVAQAPEFRVNTSTQNDQAEPAVDMNASGDFVVVWQSYGGDGSYYGVSAQRFDSTGVAQGAELQVNEYTTFEQAQPAVAMADTGEFVVVWQSYGQDGSYYGVFGRRYDASGLSPGGEFQVNSQTEYEQGYPEVDLDPAGGFVVVWDGTAADGIGYDVFAKRFNSTGQAVGSEILVNSYTPLNQFSPSVAAHSEGFVVSWQSNRGATGYDVLAQAFATDGTRQDRPVVANTFDPGSQVQTSVSSNASGQLVIAWTSDLQDGSSSGVYSQRFCMGPSVSGLELQPLDGGPALLFTWTDPPGAAGYRVVEADLPVGPFATVTGEAETGTTGLTVPMPPGDKYYLVSGLGASCSAPVAGVPAGSVPDGDDGPPLTVQHAALGQIALEWGESCLPADGDFVVYEGMLGDFTTPVASFCSTGGDTTLTFLPTPGNTFYLVAPRNATREGSYGTRSDGTERPLASPRCLLQSIEACP